MKKILTVVPSIDGFVAEVWGIEKSSKPPVLLTTVESPDMEYAIELMKSAHPDCETVVKGTDMHH